MLKCDYPKHTIESSIWKAKLQGPAPKPTSKDNIIPFVTTHYSNFSFEPLVNKIRHLICDVSNNDYLSNVFSNSQIVLSQKQPKNVLSQLTKAKFVSHNVQLSNLNEHCITKCNDKRCNICKLYLQTDDNFELANGKIWTVKSKISCHSINIIYFLKCNKCNGETSYIGKSNNLRFRTNGHISSCRLGSGTDKFDIHVFNCSGSAQSSEPFFKLYPMLTLKNEYSLTTYETHFHKLGYDTMNR